MAQLLEQLQEWIERIILMLGYPGIALVMALENLFPPIPSELVMPFAGFLTDCSTAGDCGAGRFTLPGVIIAGTVGAVVGALILYYVGYVAREDRTRRFIQRYGRWLLIDEHDLDRALDAFSRHGQAVVFFGRLMPLIRSLISIPAGIRRMPLLRFLVFTTAGSVAWNTLLAVAGRALGANWTLVLEWVDQYETVVWVLFGLAVAAFLFWKLVYPQLRSNKRETT